MTVSKNEEPILRRELTYAEAINEALTQAMELSDDVTVLGQLVDYKSGVFGTTTGLVEKYGSDRVQDFPVSEGLMTSAAIGACLGGLRPVLIHQRVDFMMYSLDAIVNWLSLWRFKSNETGTLPVTIRAIVGRGWGQGPQHSKSMHSWFAHLPGLNVAMPATAYDAKGLLLESIFGENPTIIIETRSLFSMKDHVPETPYRVRYGQAITRRPGAHVTLVALGMMVPLALQAAARLSEESIDVEVIDLRTPSPLDRESISSSVAKTGRLVVVDPGWQSVGMSAEVIAVVSETVGRQMKTNPVRVSFPDSHTPMSSALEQKFYPTDETIADAIRSVYLEKQIA